MDDQGPARVSDHEPAAAHTDTDVSLAPRVSTDCKSVSFTHGDADSSNTGRKRNPHFSTEDEHTQSDEGAAAREMSNTNSDESEPIMRGARAGKDYNSISPRLSARSTGAESRIVQEGTQGAVQRGREQHRAEREAADVERKEGTRWAAFWEKYGSVELENKGSVARDHLALERTFLAWLRTSLSFASIGIAVTQLFRLNSSLQSSSPDSPSPQESPAAHLRHVGKPLGATFVAISIVILAIGFHRYFEAQHYVIRGKFPASRGSVILVSVVAGALILSSLVVILVVAPGAFEK
ncbi:uncharacterized protein N0V89_006983 [Didymosphaeria variabile]|uniref:DUF202 domain-containing protein n=1 Tax=Didymosphaeria variabile TaxID=1932322 RepID=A0A9W9C9R6_9PLEO|nr:uncharacterized protein N0V89_006983 [Didymosphaeria variabile]KAJ4351640.1 hypothetical protein N0V89_006983 [Didymosphaeria variabile]